MFIDKTFKAGKISASEKMRLQDSIELEDRKPKSEENVKDSLKKEFSRLRIKHNRVEHTKDDESKKSDVTSFYTNGDSRSRYNAWKNSPSFGNFKCSNSKPNFWRSKSGNQYVRNLSSSSSKGFRSSSRLGSASRTRYDDQNKTRDDLSDSELKNIKETLKKIEKDVRELKKLNVQVLILLQLKMMRLLNLS